MTNHNVGERWRGKIFAIIGKLDNGSHSSNQLQGADEAITELVESLLAEQMEEVGNRVYELQKLTSSKIWVRYEDVLALLQSKRGDPLKK